MAADLSAVHPQSLKTGASRTQAGGIKPTRRDPVEAQRGPAKKTPTAFDRRIKIREKCSSFRNTAIGLRLALMKALTRDQIQSRKDQAVRFTRDVLDDPERADEIEDESLEDYAERRKFSITNPNGRSTHMADGKTKAELEAQIEDLEAENQDLQDQLDAIADIAGGGDQDDEDSDDDDDEDDTDDGNGDDDQD